MLALSLADELASAFDTPGDSGGAGGLSLAEEFGLDMDPEEEEGDENGLREYDLCSYHHHS